MALEALEIYRQRYKNFIDREKVGTSKGIFRILRVVAPYKAELAESIYGYMRVIDDAADEYKHVREVVKLLQQEREALKAAKPTTLQAEFYESVLSTQPEAVQIKIRREMFQIMSGQLIDARNRLTQVPLSQRQLRARHFMNCWPVVKAFAIGALDSDPKPTAGIVSLMDGWGTYDCLTDLNEDLGHGLVLISDKDLEEYQLNFQPGLSLPSENLRRYYLATAKTTKRQLVEAAPSIFKVGLPPWFAAISYVYFYTRQYKFAKGLHNLETVVNYTPPADVLKA